jgi:F-type H+-transporting ATPase subunit epsilon
MYEKPFTVEIVTPVRVVFKGQVSSFSAPGVEGGFQILAGHAPFMSAIGIGPVTIKSLEGTDTSYATSGGFVEVRNNTVTLLAETAERADEIDVNRAEASRDRARERIESYKLDTDIDRARGSMARALNRLRVAGRL